MPDGISKLRLDFDYGGRGNGKDATATFYVNDEEVAKGRVEKTVAARFRIDTFGVGEDSGSPVTFDYEPPFVFTGTIQKVEIEVK